MHILNNKIGKSVISVTLTVAWLVVPQNGMKKKKSIAAVLLIETPCWWESLEKNSQPGMSWHGTLRYLNHSLRVWWAEQHLRSFIHQVPLLLARNLRLHMPEADQNWTYEDWKKTRKHLSLKLGDVKVDLCWWSRIHSVYKVIMGKQNMHTTSMTWCSVWPLWLFRDFFSSNNISFHSAVSDKVPPAS